jgi:lipopolysaccharide transport system permease protein
MTIPNPRVGQSHQWPLLGHTSLVAQMVRREVIGRYRGSLLGVFWSLVTPLLMLAVYTFVFGTVFKARWAGTGTETSPWEFAIILFAGLLVFQIFSEVVSRAPTLILANVNYVKKVIFPLEILPPVALGSALCHAGVSLVVLFGFMFAVNGSIPLTAFWMPVVLGPYCLLILGFAWFLASLGVYYRDVNQFLGTLMTALMFLSPIFFPLSALPEWLRPWIVLNPIAFPVEATRAALIFGEMPDGAAFAVYSLISVVVAVLGYAWFQKTRRGFADVL